MKILFMGTPEFARANLTALCESRHEVVAVVTGRDVASGRGRRLHPTACRIEADSRDLPVHMPKSLKSRALFDELAGYNADLNVVAAFRILPRSLYSQPRLGSINIHASLLPKYRGAAPINWALINGETETGLTSFFLADSVDSGDIILQESFEIESEDNFDSLYARFVERTGPFLLRTIDAIEAGRKEPLPQDHRVASPAPKLFPKDALISFEQEAEQVRNFVRGMSTRPGAYTWFRGKKLKIYTCTTARGYEGAKSPAGTVMVEKKRLLVWCADVPVELKRIVPEGKKEMDGAAFLNGFRPRPGEVLGVNSPGE